MTRCKAGDVILVEFPFTDLSATKRRPALVLSTPAFTKRHGDVVVMAMTRQPQRRKAGAIRLAHCRPSQADLAQADHWNIGRLIDCSPSGSPERG
jgi:mRNA-degrading endonuclease toxin of MazEF toxin-antitoxin module